MLNLDPELLCTSQPAQTQQLPACPLKNKPSWRRQCHRDGSPSAPQRACRIIGQVFPHQPRPWEETFTQAAGGKSRDLITLCSHIQGSTETQFILAFHTVSAGFIGRSHKKYNNSHRSCYRGICRPQTCHLLGSGFRSAAGMRPQKVGGHCTDTAAVAPGPRDSAGLLRSLLLPLLQVR